MISGSIAIIADGNRRWAAKNGFPSRVGHLQGVYKIGQVCEWALRRRLESVIVYAFSSRNWRRSKTEIDELFAIAEDYFRKNLLFYQQHDISVTFVGRRDRLPASLVRMMTEVEGATSDCYGLNLFILVDYSGRGEIVRAALCGASDEAEFTDAIEYVTPTPDLIFRPGGRHRLSDFLTWQAADCEIEFSDTLFPDLTDEELDAVYDRARAAVKNHGV